MKKITQIFLFLFFSLSYSQSPTCETASAICSGQGGPYNNTNTTTAGGNAAGYGTVDCLFLTPYPAWFYMQVGQSGSMDFTLLQTVTSGNPDVDFALWGPFSSLGGVCNSLFDYSAGYTGPDNVVDCSYSGSATETINIPNGIAGQYYMLLVTNYGQQPGTYTINQTGGTGALSCEIVCGVSLGPDQLYCSTAINSHTLTATFAQAPTAAGTPTYQWFLEGVLQTTTATNTLVITQNGNWSVEVVRPGCSDVATDSVLITFDSPPTLNTPPSPIDIGCGPFDLTTLIPAMVAPELPSDFVVYFYEDFVDCLDGNANFIATPTAYTPTASIDIYIRVENLGNPTCFNFDFVSLIYNCSALNASVSANTICSGNTGTVTFTGTPNAVVTYTVDGSPNQTITLDATGQFILTTSVLTANSVYTLVDVSDGTTTTTLTGVTATVTVNGLPTATISGTTDICSGSSTNLTFTGTADAIVTYTDGTSNFTTTLVGGTSTVSVSPTTTTTYSLVSVASNTTPVCTATPPGSAVVTVSQQVTGSLSYTPFDFCTIDFGTYAPTVVISGAGIGTCASTTPVYTATPAGLTIDATTGVITPSTSLVGTYTITLTYPACGGCGVANFTTTVTVSSPGSATISYTTPLCTNDAATYAPTLAGAASATNYTATPAGLAIDLITGVISPSASTAGTYTINYSPASVGACVIIGTPTTVTITAAPTAVISYAGTPYCSDIATGQAVTLTGTNAYTGGSFSASPAGLTIDASTGAITPSGSTAGTYTVTYTIPASAGCASSTVSTTLTIIAVPQITLTSSVASTNQTICVNTAIANITYAFSGSVTGVNVVGLPAGVTASTTGNVVTISGTPTSATAATFNYTITAIGSICGTPSLSGSITLTNGIVPTFTQANPVCENVTINLPTTSTNGITGVWQLLSSTANDATYEFTPDAGQCALNTQMTIQIYPRPVVTATVLPINGILCSGDTVDIQLTSNVPGAVFSWNASSTTVTGYSGSAPGSTATVINQTLVLDSGVTGTGMVVYTIFAEANGCVGEAFVIPISVNPIPDLIINGDNPLTICSGETTNISFDSSINNTVFTWVVQSNTGVSGASNGSGVSLSQTLETTGLSQGEVVYQVTPSLNGCVGTPATITVYVNPIPQLFGDPNHPELCSADGNINANSTTNIGFSSFYPNTTFTWVSTSYGVSGATSGSVTGSSVLIADILYTTANAVGYVDYVITPDLNGCSGASVTVRVYVNPLPEPVLADGTICVDTSGVTFQTYLLDTGLDAATYDFVWYVDGVAQANSDAPTFTANVVGTYSVIVTNSTTNCVSAEEFAVVTATTPADSFTTLVTDAFSNNATITVNVVGGTGTLLYQIDEGAFQSSNVFTGVSAGEHTVIVIDSEGCTFITQEVMIIDYPKFFTPNGDGHNDTWNISGLNQTNAKLYIFDRYGKLIKQISATDASDGWDGTYNGEQLPSTDYWFSLDYTENGAAKQFKAHFSMKR